jgi:hypothetical protein
MVESPERIRVAQDAEGFWTCREAISGSQEYTRSDIAERQIAELRAELINRVNYWSELYSKEYHRAEAAEAENARLRALPLKDEVERVLIWYENNGAGCRLIHSGGDAHRAALAADGGNRARALLPRLRAGEQEGWRPIETAPKDGTLILLAKAGDPDWALRCRRWQDTHWRGHDAEDATHWMPLPAAPSEQGGDRS